MTYEFGTDVAYCRRVGCVFLLTTDEHRQTQTLKS